MAQIVQIVLILLLTAAASFGATNLGSKPRLQSDSPKWSVADEFEDLIKEAVELANQKKFDEALAKCAAAAALRPSDYRPHYIAGQTYYLQWKMKSASAEFAKAIELKPGDKGLYLYKSKADRSRNAKDEAVAAAREAIKLDANYAEAHVALADALSIGAKDYSEIIQAYRTAIKLKPVLFDVYDRLGMFLKVSKDEKGAEEVYRKAMELDPKKMAGRFALGRLLVDQRRLTEARELWNGRSSDVDRTFPNFITLLERAEKRKVAEETLAKSPNDPQALLQMGLIVMDGESWVVDGRQVKALDYLKKALEIDPKFTNAQFAICKAYIQLAAFDKKNDQDVDRELNKLRTMDPKLADEIANYRKNYSGGLQAVSAGDQ